ncbi:MAG: family 10 glycosylhydrolase [Betaproteobacteria bacterium]|nr:family 10 glycosylhydrolase [Betaproteobacteria bacterium]
MVRESLTPTGLERRALVAALALAVSGCAGLEAPGVASGPGPPPAPREFRAAWIASVANIDWPSRPGLSVQAQKAEIRRLVERAKSTGLNALILQVRPAADALYPSALEPWSEYLTGTQGKAPEPFYDPLALWIEEAHRNGLELHAWFNPYRARHPSAKGPLAQNHIASIAPGLAKSYGTYLWLDPGEPDAARHTLAVILDVVRRYDIDGVHIDDYFYPYPTAVPGTPPEAGLEIGFPDEPSWQAYLGAGGTLARADWRRRNVNRLMERIDRAVHDEKPWVRFGISPFGIGRPDRRPPGITGFSQYDKLYADVELWLANGWLDYLAPQLYWPIDDAPHAFGTLLDYWQGENARGRHIWPGLFTSRIDDTPKSWTAGEILGQVSLSRAHGATGHIHFSMAALRDNRKAIADRLQASSYAAPALVPATPWLGNAPPPAPSAQARGDTDMPGMAVLEIRAAPSSWLVAVWSRYETDWVFSVVPASTSEVRVPMRAGDRVLEALVVSAIDRLGAESDRVTVLPPGASAKAAKEGM